MKRFFSGGALLALALLMGAAWAQASAQRLASPEARAVAYLREEVPRWRREHPCYSCHNNGDGTRALVAAARHGLADVRELDDTVSWLRAPERWALNSEDGGVKDLPLARIQFASALQELVRSIGAEAPALARAAELVIADQRPDGSWPISAAATIGSPAAYGTPLATAVARQTLARVGSVAARQAVMRADAWLRAFRPESVLDASATVLGVGDAPDAAASVRRQEAVSILLRGQARDGGWGPYVTSQSESFDTAVALLAIWPLRSTDPRLAAAAARARQYLVTQQEPAGNWPETTRPAGNESYAQRISTTGWALMALLESQ